MPDRTMSSEQTAITLTNSPKEVLRACSFLDESAKRLGLPERVVFALNLSLDEILAVVMQSLSSQNDTQVIVRLRIAAGEALVEIEDNGPVTNITQHIQADGASSIKKASMEGLGITLVRKMLDDLRYRRENDRNIVTLVKKY